MSGIAENGELHYSYVIDRLAAQLQSHISAVEELKKSIALYDAVTTSKKQYKELIIKALENLRELRESIVESVVYLMNAASKARSDEIEDAEALLEYYLEAAYKFERRILEDLNNRIDCKDDINSLDETKALVESALNVIRSYKRV
jgi:MinD-like ATPase involved in chromosome partitioning or flagellar assembly